MHSQHFKRSAVARLLVAMAAAFVVWPAAARASDITVFSATAGVPFDGVVAVVTNDCITPTTDCRGLNPSVDIDWGDGSTKTRVAAKPDCPATGPCLGPTLWTVSVAQAPHTYARPGAYAASFTGPIFIGTTHIDAIVGDDPHSITESVPPLTPVVGAAVSGPIATFTDTNPLVQASAFTATINWGDGSTTPATVSQPLGQPFQVSGSHVYAHVGSFPVTVAIQHVPINPSPLGASANKTTTATVGDAKLTGAGDPVTAVAGVPFKGVVAAFTDPNPFATASDFSATVTWARRDVPGHGQRRPGRVHGDRIAHVLGVGADPRQRLGVKRGGSKVTIATTASVTPAPPPPVTTVTLSPAAPTGRHGWYRSAVHATVSARSLAGAVAQTRCRLDGIAPVAFAALPAACPFAGAGADITGDGRHELFAASITDGGQAELPRATEIAIDRTPRGWRAPGPHRPSSRAAPARR